MEGPGRIARNHILAELDRRMARVVEDGPALGHEHLDEGWLVAPLGLAIQPGFEQPLGDGGYRAFSPETSQSAG